MQNNISFTSDVKREICSKEFDSISAISFLSGFVRINATYKIKNKNEILILTSYDSFIIKIILSLFEKYLSSKGSILYSEEKKLKKRNKYTLYFEDNVYEILKILKIDVFNSEIDSSLIDKQNKIYSYIAGVFLACGRVSSASSTNYHLEIELNNANLALNLQKLLNSIKNASYNFRLIKRRTKYVLYIKRSDLISSFLVMIGAVNSYISYENIRVEREFANNENRIYNLDTANYSKTINSCTSQIENIKKIERVIGIKNIDNEKIRILCEERLNNKEASLQELSNIMSKRLNTKVSRSNIYHLFNKIKQLSERL